MWPMTSGHVGRSHAGALQVRMCGCSRTQWHPKGWYMSKFPVRLRKGFALQVRRATDVLRPLRLRPAMVFPIGLLAGMGYPARLLAVTVLPELLRTALMCPAWLPSVNNDSSAANP